MTTTNRIEILAMIAIACSTANALAAPTAPTITSGTGSITQNTDGTYVVVCTADCRIDWQNFSIGNDQVINFAQPTTGVSLNAITNLSGSVFGNVETGALNGTVATNSGNAFVNTGGTLTAGNYSIGNVGGTLSISGATVSTSTYTSGTLAVGNYTVGNGASLTTTDTTILSGATTSIPDATPNPFGGGNTNTGTIGLTGTTLTDETRISWNGTTLFALGTFALVTPTNTGTNSGPNSTLIRPGNIANAGGSIAIGNGIFLSTTAQGTIVATLGPNGPALPTANITADPATFSTWLNDNALVTNTQVDSIGTLIRSGLNSVLFGSHHRILLDNGMTDTGNGFWATGDFARHDPNNTDASIGEFGAYKDVTPTLRLGAGVGVNQARQGLPLNGSGKLDSRYLVLEGDYRAIESGWTGSATAYLGSNRSTISRGYMVGIAPNLSSGDANGSSWAIRLRSDWSNVATLQEWNVSPYLAYTHAESRLDGYSETGGALPVAFAAQKQTSDELRVGVTLLSRLSEQTDLRFPLELAHRSNGSAMVSGVAAATPFSFVNAGSTQNWGRAGIELDHRLNNQTVLNGAALCASRGGDSSWLATIGLRHAF